MMSQEKNLIKAIVADPANDEPRLVFADWAEEHGDPERAEFIRLQCESARMPFWDPSREELSRQANVILSRNEKVWGKPVKDLAVRAFRFQRGFLEHVVLNGKTNFDLGNEIFKACPTINSVKFRQLGQVFDELLRKRWLKNVRSLNLTVNSCAGDKVQRIVGSANLQQLESLSFHSCGIKQKGVQSLFGSNKLPRLRRLNINGSKLNSVSMDSIGDLLVGPRMETLEWLSVLSMGWPVDEIEAVNALVSQVDGTKLRHFEFGNHDFSGNVDVNSARRSSAGSSLEPFCDSSFLKGLEYLKVGTLLSNDHFSTLCNHPEAKNLRSLVVLNASERQVKILLEAKSIWENLKYVELGRRSTAKLKLLSQSRKTSQLQWLGFSMYGPGEKIEKQVARKHQVNIAFEDPSTRPSGF